jgi:hypothetical protein
LSKAVVGDGDGAEEGIFVDVVGTVVGVEVVDTREIDGCEDITKDGNGDDFFSIIGTRLGLTVGKTCDVVVGSIDDWDREGRVVGRLVESRDDMIVGVNVVVVGVSEDTSDGFIVGVPEESIVGFVVGVSDEWIVGRDVVVGVIVGLVEKPMDGPEERGKDDGCIVGFIVGVPEESIVGFVMGVSDEWIVGRDVVVGVIVGLVEKTMDGPEERGKDDGFMVGFPEGTVGRNVGDGTVGERDGSEDGIQDGLSELSTTRLGLTVGKREGSSDCVTVGVMVGVDEGESVGDTEGRDVGPVLGWDVVGVLVGRRVGVGLIDSLRPVKFSSSSTLPYTTKVHCRS